MKQKKWALGMGDTEYLNNGVFDSKEDAHKEAVKLRNVPHDNGDYHDSYIIGEILCSTEVAQSRIDEITPQLMEHFKELLREVESFGDMDGDEVDISSGGVQAMKNCLKDILEEHTEYHSDLCVGRSETFTF